MDAPGEADRCGDCGSHVLPSDETCPHCGAM
jgi:uncharacterized OB-fold protein